MTGLCDLFPFALVDAHHHLWNPVSATPDLGYGWLRDIGAPKPFGDPTPIQRDYLADEFLSEPAPLSLAASVHVQADGALPDPVAETAFVAAQAAAAGHSMAIVGMVDMTRSDAAEVIARHACYEGFRGVRQIVARLPGAPGLSFAPRDLMAEPGFRASLDLLARNGLSFDLQLYPEQMTQAADLFASVPDLNVILNHAGSPYRQDTTGLALWGDGIARLATLPRMSVKLSGWGMFDPRWTAASITPMVAHLLDRFGPDRVMFGSNYPVEKLAKPYSEMLRDLHGAVHDVDPQAIRPVFRDTAVRVYRPPAPQPSA